MFCYDHDTFLINCILCLILLGTGRGLDYSQLSVTSLLHLGERLCSKNLTQQTVLYFTAMHCVIRLTCNVDATICTIEWSQYDKIQI